MDDTKMINKIADEINRLEQEVQELKCCGNCKHWINGYYWETCKLTGARKTNMNNCEKWEFYK